MLVTNELLQPLYADQIIRTLQLIGVRVDLLVLPDGEQYKTLNVLEQIFSALLEKCHGRDTTLIALGGGVIGDLVGFAAACYQRGVRLIQIPTSLLAQVDASVGGKTAVNHRLGKNMIGAFYQPVSVIIDLNCLQTLPRRELIAGLAEVIKYGVALDGDFFSWLEHNMSDLLVLEPTKIAYCISHCCKLKAQIVSTDERETGWRALLNLGHTYAHAIETEMGYGHWLHGEAVAVGMVMAAQTAYRLDKFSMQNKQRLIRLLLHVGLPVSGPSGMSAEAYWSHMQRDKKVLSGQVRLILPTTIGCAEIYNHVTHEVVLAAINDCQTQY